MRLFRFSFVSFFSVPYVNVFSQILHAFFPRFVCKFRSVYICVILSCSFRVSLSSVTLVTFWFPEPRFQHLVSRLVYRLYLYLPLSFLLSSVSYFVVIHFVFISRNLPSCYGKLLNLVD